MRFFRDWIARHGLLDMAGLVTWAAVALAVVGSVPSGLTFRSIAVAVLLVAFILGFFAFPRAPASSKLQPRMLLAIATMIASGFGLTLIGPHHSTPILFILLAGVAGYRLSLRPLIALLIALACGQLLVYALEWNVPNTFLLWITYCAFQAFSASATYALRTADERSAELRRINAQLLATSDLLEQTARDTERLRLSRELHDVSGHKLTALKLNLTLLARDTQLRERKELTVAASLADELLSDIRDVVTHLRRHDGIDIRQALQRIVDAIPRPRVHLDIPTDLRVEDAAQATAILRVAQEAVTNAMRHSIAQNVWLKLEANPQSLEVTVMDDGAVRWPVKPGNGLRGMTERATALGGSLNLQLSDGGGLCVRMSVPRSERTA